MSLEEAVKDPSRRVQLEGLRDFLVHELEGNKCKACSAIKLRASDTAAMVLRLMKVLEELSLLAPEDTEEQDPIEALQEAVGQSTVVQFQEHQARQATRKKRGE